MTTNAIPPQVEYVENGVTLTHPVPFRFLAPDDLRVIRFTPATGAVQVLVRGADYSVAGAGASAGGSITKAAGGSAATVIRIQRKTARIQPMRYTANDTFPAASHEAALDRGTLIAQEQEVAIGDIGSRAVQLPMGETAGTLPPAALRRGRKVLGFDAGTGAPQVQDGAAFKGDPGGNVMAIGLFTAAAGMSIPAGTTLVRTSGYATPGVGAAFYTVGNEGMGVPPQIATRFMAADGRVFRLVNDKEIDLASASPATYTNIAVGLANAFAALELTGRTNPERFGGWGVGAVTLPRGIMKMGSVFAPTSPLGFKMVGQSRHATTVSDITTGGTSFFLKIANSNTFEDWTLQKASATISFKTDPALVSEANPQGLVYDAEGTPVATFDPGSIGIHVFGENGGGFLSAHRFSIDGYDICIRNSYDGNGDKSMFQECLLVGGCVYDNTGNTQAIGWTFLNCAGHATKTHFRLGGVGMTAIINYVCDTKGSYMAYPDHSGSPHYPEDGRFWPGSTLTIATKIEQHGDANYPGPNLLIDARDSTTMQGAGGTGFGGTPKGATNVSAAFIDTHITGSPNITPNPDNTDIIVVGNEFDGNKGSTEISLQFLFGWVRGIVKWNSLFRGKITTRVPFLHMLMAPKPEKAKLLGTGFHPMMEWRANENVPVDQYRGGQSAVCTIDATKAFLFRDTQNRAIDTTTGAANEGSVFAKYYVLPGFPPGCTITGCALLITNDNGTTTGVATYRDAFATGVTGYNIPGGSKGLIPVAMNDASKWITVGADGNVYIRMTKPGAGQWTEGALVIYYFPYGG